MLSDKVDNLSATSEGLRLPSGTAAPSQQCGLCCYYCFAEHGMPPPGCGDLSLTLPSPLAISRPLEWALLQLQQHCVLLPQRLNRRAVLFTCHVPPCAFPCPLNHCAGLAAGASALCVCSPLLLLCALGCLPLFCAHVLFCHLCLCHYMSFAPSWVVARCVLTLHHCRYH